MTAELLGALQRRAYVGNRYVEDRVTSEGRAAADPAADAGSVFGGQAIDETLTLRLRDLPRNRGRHAELPSEQVAVVAAETVRVLADDLE